MNTVITQNELNMLTNQELGELHQLLTLLLANAEPASQERRNILASLENITRARFNYRAASWQFAIKP